MPSVSLIDCKHDHHKLIQGFRAPEAKELVKSLPTVMDYADRIRHTFFPDYVFNL